MTPQKLTLAEFPTEILSLIFQHLNDVVDYTSVALTCRKFQATVKTLVVSVGDAHEQCSTFKHITNEYVYLNLDDAEELSHFKSKLRRYKHFIFEYSYHSRVHRDRYIETINKSKGSSLSRVTEVILTEDAARNLLMIKNVDDIRKSRNHYTFDVIRTIFLNESDQGIVFYRGYSEDPESLRCIILVGRVLNFTSINVVPPLSVIINPYQPLVVHGKCVQSFKGCLNFDRSGTSSTVVTDQQFFKNSTFVNTRQIENCCFATDTDSTTLEKFKHLETLKLLAPRSFPRNFKYLMRGSTHFALKKLVISGYSIIIHDVDFPNLDSLELNQVERGKALEISEMSLKNIDMPKIRDISLTISSACTKSFGEVIESLLPDILSVKKLKLLGMVNTVDFTKKISFSSLESISLIGCLKSEIENEIVDFMEENGSIVQHLKDLEIRRLYNFQNSMFFSKHSLYSLKNLTLTLAFKDFNLGFNYILDRSKFPLLETLEIKEDEFSQDIDLYIKSSLEIGIDLPGLKRLSATNLLLSYCIYWVCDNDGVEILTIS